MSAFSLGSIRAVMGLDSSDYTKGILNAQTANEVFGHSVTNFVNNPILGAIRLFKDAVVGTVNLAKETAFLNQEYLRTSERLGVSTRTISGLQMAYRDMGLSTQEVERQLSKLAQKQDEASQGNQTSLKLFERLGVMVTDTTGNLRPLDEILRDVSDGLAGLGSQQEKVAIGNLLFGESFVKVNDIVGHGGRVIDEFIDKSHRFGQVVGEDAARGSDRLASAIGDLGFAFEGAKRRIATSFVGALGNELDGVEKAIDRLNSKAQSFETAAASAGASFGRWLGDMIKGYEILAERQAEREQALKREQQLNAFQSSDDARSLLNGTRAFDGFGGQIVGIPSYREAVREELARYGVTAADVMRAARSHYPDELAEDLELVHLRQENARRLRAMR